MTATTSALQQLRAVLDGATTPEAWRWQARRALTTVRDTLLDGDDPDGRSDGWLVARNGTVRRERDLLLARLGRLGREVLTSPDLPAMRRELHRLHADVSHHLQRRRDLVWDEVELELGGSD